jgi:hypothetical protein
MKSPILQKSATMRAAGPDWPRTGPGVPSGLVFDPVRGRQCVGSLVSNAIRFTSQGEVIIMASSEPIDGGDHADTGPAGRGEPYDAANGLTPGEPA